MTLNDRNDGFYRKLWLLVIPITIQSLINQAVNAADVFMLGYVGQNELSAVSLAGQMQFLVTGFFWGSTSGVALMIAQYWGKRDTDSIQSVMGIGFKVSLAFTALISLASLAAPAVIMRIFTDDAALVEIGVSYLRIIGVTFVLESISQIYECSLRNMGRAATATVLSAVALGGNLVLNALLIFGWFGLPKLGVLGVAVATLIARVAEAALCLADMLRAKPFRYELPKLLRRNTLLIKDFLRYSLPALFNDVSWTVAFSTYSIILGHLGTDVVAASAVATTVRDLSTVLCMSLGSAAVAILGEEIGRNETELARRDGRRIVILSVVFGAVTGVVILLLRPLLIVVYTLSDGAADYLKFMLLVSAYYVIGQSVNTAIITGVFRAGGDTRFGMICDTVNMWCIALPVGFICAFALKLPPKTVYFILCLDEFYKIPAEYIHYKKYGWLKNITRDAGEIETV